MPGKKLFYLLLLLYPVVSVAQSTAKDWYTKGIELKEKSDYENALGAFKNAINKDAKYNEAYYQAGWCCNELERYEDAVEFLKKYVPTTNDLKKDKYNELGFCYLNLEDSKNAIDNFHKTISIFPNDGLALRGLGTVYYDLIEDHDSAIHYFEKSLKADETGPGQVYYKLGWLYNDKERFDDAITILLKGIENDSENSGLREELGFAYYMNGEYEFAITQLNKAISLDEESKLGYYYKGLCLVSTNKKGEAMGIYYKLKELGVEEADLLLEKINKMKS